MNEAAIGTPVTETEHEDAFEQAQPPQNFGLAIVAGLAAAMVGAVLWALFVYLTNYQLGLVAIAVGALVGYAVRTAGHGIEPRFGFLGGVCAALGWALGTILCDLAFVAKEVDRPILTVIANLGVGQTMSLAFQNAGAMDILFLAIAVWEGYKLSFLYRRR
jgi:hypothetical protein